MASELYYYRPSTPPAILAGAQHAGTSHSRTTSGSSIYTNSDSSPDSAATSITTPSRSPYFRQNGPTLLPKIRPQDVVVEPTSHSGPYRHRKALSATQNPPGYAPYPSSRPSVSRRPIDPPDCSQRPSISTASTLGSQLGSALIAPHSRKRQEPNHSRSSSSSSIDESTLSRYGYPTYRQMPKYVCQYNQTAPASSATGLNYPTAYQPVHEPYVPPTRNVAGQRDSYAFADSTASTLGAVVSAPIAHHSVEDSASTTLLQYLSSPTQAINLVQSVVYPSARVNQTHFWWDIRNLRQWSSFSLPTINSIPGLTQLLTTQVPQDRTPPTNVSPCRLSPESEFALTDLVRDIYAPRVNAALRISQGRDCLSLYPAPIPPNHRDIEPHFLANYASDKEQTPSGLPRGRVVGLVKSFDRWNTGMRNEQPHRRVEYLNGLAHLQRCMREHSCRYGFIMTEIELVCVRAGCDNGDDVPYFGYLELAAPIATKTSSTSYFPMAGSVELSRSHSASSTQSSDYSASSRGASPTGHYHQPLPAELSGSLTATLALYYLLMLSKSVPLPTQASWHLNVGGPGAMTRQRILTEGKDKWIPEPQQKERREARRSRGWIWPHDAWHRREGGGSSRSRAAKAAAAKRWHK